MGTGQTIGCHNRAAAVIHCQSLVSQPCVTAPVLCQVSMRACAREVGFLAIQAAAVERCLDEDLGKERKALLAALATPAGRSVRDIAAGQHGAHWRCKCSFGLLA